MTMIFAFVALVSLGIWVYLLLLRGLFWRADRELEENEAELENWPSVVVLVPARDEAEVIVSSLDNLLSQDYPGDCHIILIDDHSQDGTARLAAARAKETGNHEHLTVVRAGDLPAGWSGKVWALAQGLKAAEQVAPGAAYIWLTDADISHWHSNLRQLVLKAETDKLDMVSLMAMLSCESKWERLLIPSFVFFFQMLYPFRWVSNPKRETAAAAGGCILVNAEALAAAGGFRAIKGEVIDDCALAKRLKKVALERGRRIWLGIGTECESLRPYETLEPIWDMVARTAYTQLGCSPRNLKYAMLGMFLTFLVPPLALIGGLIGGFFLDLDNIGSGLAVYLSGMASYGLMALAAWPTNEHYEEPFWKGFLLPLAALVYMAMTISSARRHKSGRGTEWKGRIQAAAPAAPAVSGKLEEGLPGG